MMINKAKKKIQWTLTVASAIAASISVVVSRSIYIEDRTI
jgi:hypothetical protein